MDLGHARHRAKELLRAARAPRPADAQRAIAAVSAAIPGAAGRLDGYLEATSALLAAGARVTDTMIELAADAVAVRVEEAAP